MLKRLLIGILVLAFGTATFAATTGGVWAVQHAPASATQATISKAANSGAKHVADCVIATFAALTTAPAAIQVSVVVRDGATGTGTILAQWNMSLPATGGSNAAPLVLCPTGGLGLIGTSNTAMTAEFTASGGANTIESVFIKGHDEKN